jgi:hypothetical protein
MFHYGLRPPVRERVARRTRLLENGNVFAPQRMMNGLGTSLAVEIHTLLTCM